MEKVIDFLSSYAGVIGLILFFVFFTLMVIWVYRPNAKDIYSNYAKTPLCEPDDRA